MTDRCMSRIYPVNTLGEQVDMPIATSRLPLLGIQAEVGWYNGRGVSLGALIPVSQKRREQCSVRNAARKSPTTPRSVPIAVLGSLRRLAFHQNRGWGGAYRGFFPRFLHSLAFIGFI